MKLHEISNNGSLTPAQIKWLDEVVKGSYEVVDGKINVDGGVSLPRDAESIPVQFGKVNRFFDCQFTQITSLEGCPSEVVGNFSCSGTKITSLKGSPSKVGGSFYCTWTYITSLEGCMSKINGDFHCNNTKITSLVGVADNNTQINGNFFADWDKIESGGLGLVLIPGVKDLFSESGLLPDPFEIIYRYLDKPNQLFDCQAELIENGFEEYAQL